MYQNWTEVDIHWSFVFTGDESEFHAHNRLYFYYQINPFGHSIFNIGKAVGRTPAQRYWDDDKVELRKRILIEFKVPQFRIIVGELRRRDQKPVAPALIADVERLLIHSLQPYCNTDCKQSLNVNYVLSVECRASGHSVGKIFSTMAKLFLDLSQQVFCLVSSAQVC